MDDKKVEAFYELYWVLAYLSAELDEIDTLLDEFKLKEIMVDHMLPLYYRNKEALPLIRIIGNLISQNQTNATYFLENGMFLKALKKFLQACDRVIKKEALWVLSNLTSGSSKNVQLLMKDGILNSIIGIINEDNFDIRKEGGYSVLNCLAKEGQSFPKELLTSLRSGFMEFLKSKDYAMIELGLQYFISVFHYYPKLGQEMEESSFIKTVEDILLVFNDQSMHELTTSVLNAYSDLLEEKLQPQDKKAKL
ncbi:ARM repeat-containing protein, partial [Neoconidiobolus thromboides FSU 785]